MAAGQKAAFTFDGTSVSWISTKGRNRGIAEVWLGINGGPLVRAARVDLYATATLPRQMVFNRNGLPDGTHTLEIRVLGTRNPASGGTRVDIDAFAVIS